MTSNSKSPTGDGIDQTEFVLPDPVAVAISAVLQAYDHTSARLIVEAKGPASLYRLLLVEKAADGTLTVSPDPYVSRKDRVRRPLIRIVLDARRQLLNFGSVLFEDR